MSYFNLKDWFNSLLKDKNLRRFIVSHSDWMIDRNDNGNLVFDKIYKKLDKDDIKKCEKCEALFFKEDIYERSTIKVGKDLKESLQKNYYCKRCLETK